MINEDIAKFLMLIGLTTVLKLNGNALTIPAVILVSFLFAAGLYVSYL